MPEPRAAADPILLDLGFDVASLTTVVAGERRDGPEVDCLCVDVRDAAPTERETARGVIAASDPILSERGRVLVIGSRSASDTELASLRNHLWPTLHLQRVYRLRKGQPIERTDVRGTAALALADRDGFAFACVRRETAMAPDVTAEKFDAKAAGWNGVPGTPQYGHHRWMRRLIALCAQPRAGEKAIDAGSGAGWVGIEAARFGARMSAFDPSPEMVRFVKQNAEDNGVAVDARVGFVEDPPFAEDFDLVLNSGVISFAPDANRFLDGIDRLVRRGGRLVIGDLNPRSWGFTRRRRQRLMVPVRELNALTRDEVVARLKQRGYRIEFVRYYQLTWPIPEIAHRSNSRLLCWLLLQQNRAASAIDALFGARAAVLFDSWIIGARRGS